MTTQSASKLDHVDSAATARIDRRQTILAQLEAALLADKLSVIELHQDATGTDPYNSMRARSSTWTKSAR